MAEEHACLVRAHSDSESSSKLGSFGSLSKTMTYTEEKLTEGSGEPGNTVTMVNSPPDEHAEANDSGELIDFNDNSVLEQFHEDALRQAGCGLSQARILAACSLAVFGATLELSTVSFILPSAEIEFCIRPHEKNWLVMISMVGCSLGAVGWGPLAERLGRRRTLLSCLAVNAVFAAIAAFMPTYGTFMMARFCSAIGSGGIVPTCYTYAGEVMPRTRRARALAALCAAAGGGALCAAGLARAVLPPTGALALHENKEHFSAWHRYLLLCMLPILASLISLIWTQESPRYLLDVGREVDAMMAYQSIHSGNQLRLCGCWGCGGGGSGGGGGGGTGPPGAEAAYRLGELALPGKRRAPPAHKLHHVRHSVKMFWQAFFQLFSSAYRNTTLSLGGALLFSMAIQFYLSAYVPNTVARAENAQFEASKRTVRDATLAGRHYNATLENVVFEGVRFERCAFRDMLMSHVTYANCTFVGVAFSNIKTSYTAFRDSLFVNSTIIDTDIEIGRELEPSCVLVDTVVRGVQGGCRPDLTSRLDGLQAEHAAAAHAHLLAALLALLPPPPAPLAILSGLCLLLSPSVYAAQSETALYTVEAVYRLFLALIYFAVGVAVVDSYPAGLRCTAHGLLLSVAYLGGFIARACGEGGPLLSALLCAALAAAALAAAGLAASAAPRRR